MTGYVGRGTSNCPLRVSGLLNHMENDTDTVGIYEKQHLWNARF